MMRTQEQIKNCKIALVGIFGPYAMFMSDDQVEEAMRLLFADFEAKAKNERWGIYYITGNSKMVLVRGGFIKQAAAQLFVDANVPSSKLARIKVLPYYNEEVTK